MSFPLSDPRDRSVTNLQLPDSIPSPFSGAPVLSVTEDDNGADGSVDDTTTTQNTYDSDGNLIESFQQFSFGFARTTYRYDAEGRLATILTSEVIGTSLGSRIDYSYDADNRLQQVVQTSGGTSIPTFQTTSRYFYDGDRVVIEKTERVSGSAPEPLPTVVITSIGSDHQRLQSLIYQSNVDADPATPNSNSKSNYIYNDAGHLKRIVDYVDRDGDRVADTRSRFILSYNSSGQYESIVDEFDRDLDGNADSITTATYAYNASDALASLVIERDVDADGTVDSRSMTSYCYRQSQQTLDSNGQIQLLFGTCVAETLAGDAADNQIRGRQGDDQLLGFRGNDVLVGGAGRDTLKSGAGDDVLSGKGYDDALVGRKGNDLLRGNRGDDVLKGGQGNDVMIGGQGSDRLIGGQGGDRFVLQRGKNYDVIRDFTAAVDQIDLPDSLQFESVTLIQRGSTLIIRDRQDTLARLKNLQHDMVTAADFA